MQNTTNKQEFKLIHLRPLESEGELVLPDVPPSYIEPVPSLFRRLFPFVIVVVVPVLIAISYFGFVASNQYVVEVSYVVRVLNSTSGTSALSAFGQTQNFSRSEEDTNAVNVYLRSRDAAHRLKDLVRSDLGAKQVDFMNRFPSPFSSNSDEQLYEAFRRQITVSDDGSTGISTLEVSAFDPKNALDIAVGLLGLGEELVNQMNHRAQEDTISAAKELVAEAEDKVRVEQMRMLEFRNREMIIDPQKQSTAAFELVNDLVGRVAQDEASLAQMIATSPKSPQIAPLKERIKAMKAEIVSQRAELVGDKGSIASKLAEFEQISLQKELATRSLSSAITSLETARQEAQRQQFYLETILKPYLPDQARYPRRILDIFVVLLGSLVCYWTLRKISEIIMEHKT